MHKVTATTEDQAEEESPWATKKHFCFSISLLCSTPSAFHLLAEEKQKQKSPLRIAELCRPGTPVNSWLQENKQKSLVIEEACCLLNPSLFDHRMPHHYSRRQLLIVSRKEHLAARAWGTALHWILTPFPFGFFHCSSTIPTGHCSNLSTYCFFFFCLNWSS